MEVVIAAIVTAFGAVIVEMIRRMRKENTEQHGEGRARVDALAETLGDVRVTQLEVRQDVTEIKDDVKRLDGRVEVLEQASDSPGRPSAG